MNKTVTVNLGGTVFHIDENAYEALIKYLNSIKANFSTEDGRDEIMQDIESRISEMFRERMKDVGQVITLNDVDEVTALMGRPEQFEEDENKSSTSYSAPASNLKRRLFRNPDDKLIGGVCSGMAAYFDIDPVWIRLAWALLFFLGGSGLLIYIILWIIVPEAKTTADRLQMRGEPVTIENIGKNVKEEMDSVKSRMSEGRKSASSVIGRIFQAIGEIFKFIFIAIGKIIAAFFLFIGLVVGFALFASLFGLFGFSFVHYPMVIHHMFVSPGYLGWIWFGVVLLVGIPFLMLAYAGAKMLFNIKRSSRIVGFSALGLWLIGLGLCLTLGLSTAKDFSRVDNIRKEVHLSQPSSGMINVVSDENADQEKNYGDSWHDDDWDNDINISEKDEKLFSRNVKFDIVKSPTDSFELIELDYANGVSGKAAIENASHINYSFSQSDSVLKINHRFTMDKDSKWRNQKVQLILRVPVGGKVHLADNLVHFVHNVDIKNIQNVYDDEMVNHTWEMTEHGLSCVDCDGSEKIVGHGGGHVYINGEDADNVDISDKGVHIRGHNGEEIFIDTNGVVIHKDRKGGVRIGKHEKHNHTDKDSNKDKEE